MSYKNLRTSPGYAPSLAPCKGRQSCVLDSTPWIPDSRYWIPYSLSVELGFRIPMVSGIPDSLSCFLDSKVQDSGFQNQNWIPGFRFPQAKPSRIRITQTKICRIPESGVSYTGRVSRTRRCIFILYPFFFRGSLTYRGYYMPARGYEFYLRVFNSISHSFAALTSEISSWTREDTIRIHARACNILFII